MLAQGFGRIYLIGGLRVALPAGHFNRYLVTWISRAVPFGGEMRCGGRPRQQKLKHAVRHRVDVRSDTRWPVVNAIPAPISARASGYGVSGRIETATR